MLHLENVILSHVILKSTHHSNKMSIVHIGTFISSVSESLISSFGCKGLVYPKAQTKPTLKALFNFACNSIGHNRICLPCNEYIDVSYPLMFL